MRTVARVLWRDCDPAGIMYYGSILRFVEEAEHELMAAAGVDYVAALAEGMGFPRVHFECDYHQPIRAGVELACDLRVAAVGRSAVTLRFEVGVDGADRPSVSGAVTMVCLDWRAQRPRPVPDALRRALEGQGPGVAAGGAEDDDGEDVDR